MRCGCWRCCWPIVDSDGSMGISSAAGRCVGFKIEDIELSRFGFVLSGVDALL